MNKLQVEGIHKSFKHRHVVKGVSLEVSSSSVVGLLGPNGAGKTTSFYMVVGLVSPDEGLIKLDGEAITGLPIYERARLGISYLPQEPSVFRKLTVKENILHFHIENNFSEVDQNNSVGIGLKNVKRRLSLIYPNTHELAITSFDMLFRVDLKLHIE